LAGERTLGVLKFSLGIGVGWAWAIGVTFLTFGAVSSENFVV
jgi:hypothetical protein